MQTLINISNKGFCLNEMRVKVDLINRGCVFFPKQIFEGNWDRETRVTHIFYTSVDAQYVRILPQEWYNHISIRFELMGCRSKLETVFVYFV